MSSERQRQAELFNSNEDENYCCSANLFLCLYGLIHRFVLHRHCVLLDDVNKKGLGIYNLRKALSVTDFWGLPIFLHNFEKKKKSKEGAQGLLTTY